MTLHSPILCKSKKLWNEGEDLGSFWIPLNSSIDEQLEWFSSFGQYSDIVLQIEASSEHHSSNSSVISEEFDDEDTINPTTLPVTLTDLDEDALLLRREFNMSFDAAEMAENVKNGAMKRFAKHLLHDEIVAEFSRKFKLQGAKVVADPNTVDLLVFWGEKSALFEVKTVSYRNFQSRLRLALGQVEEYSFRLYKEHGLSPDKCLILNRSIDSKSWQAEFLAEHMKVGIISRTASGTTLIPPRGCQSCVNWV